MPEDTDMSEFLLSEAEQNTETNRYMQDNLGQIAAAEEKARTAGFVETAEALRAWLKREHAKLRL